MNNHMKHALTRLLEWKPPAALALAVGLVLATVVGAVDYFTSFELTLSFFYLVPVALVAWYASRPAAFGVCGVCTAAWLVADAANGQAYPHWVASIETALVQLGFFLITASLLAALKIQLRREQLLARTDGLTKVLNGWAFEETCAKVLQLAARYDHPLALAYVDIDDFKTINDTRGHSFGDSVLKMVATTLSQSVRAADVVGRLGGDEFAVMMPETDSKGARHAFTKLHHDLKEAAQANGWLIGFSVGAALFPAAPRSMDEELKIADGLMYRAKKQGKDRLVFQVEKVPRLCVVAGGDDPRAQSRPA